MQSRINMAIYYRSESAAVQVGEPVFCNKKGKYKL